VHLGASGKRAWTWRTAASGPPRGGGLALGRVLRQVAAAWPRASLTSKGPASQGAASGPDQAQGSGSAATRQCAARLTAPAAGRGAGGGPQEHQHRDGEG